VYVCGIVCNALPAFRTGVRFSLNSRWIFSAWLPSSSLRADVWNCSLGSFRFRTSIRGARRRISLLSVSLSLSLSLRRGTQRELRVEDELRVTSRSVTNSIGRRSGSSDGRFTVIYRDSDNRHGIASATCDCSFQLPRPRNEPALVSSCSLSAFSLIIIVQCCRNGNASRARTRAGSLRPRNSTAKLIGATYQITRKSSFRLIGGIDPLSFPPFPLFPMMGGNLRAACGSSDPQRGGQRGRDATRARSRVLAWQ